MARPGLLAGGAAVGLAAAGGGSWYLYQSRRAANRLVAPTDVHLNQRAAIEEFFKRLGPEQDVALRRLRAMPLVLHQFTTCPFCNRVKVFLDCNQVPFTTVEVDPISKREIAGRPYQKLPQLTIDPSVLLVDSAEIVDILTPVVGLRNTPEVREWRRWSGDVLARYIALRMNHSLADAYANYEYIQGLDVPWSLKLKYLSAGAAMFFLAHKLVMGNLRKTGRKGDDVPAELEEELRRWAAEGVGGGPFQGGERPSTADTDVYGILQSIKGHRVYRDLRATSAAGPWMGRMEAAVAAGR